MPMDTKNVCLLKWTHTAKMALMTHDGHEKAKVGTAGKPWICIKIN
jgi:hypothetical protein